MKEQSDVENESTQDDLKEAQLLNLQRRNKEGHYHHTAIRSRIIDEIKTIFDTQCKKGHPHCTPENRDEFIKEFDFHTPIDEKQILSLVGDCTFEKKEKRAPLNSLTYEYFKWLQDVANLSFRKKGRKRSITREEQKKLMEFFQSNIKEKISYQEVRKVLELEKEEHFAYIKHSKKKEDDLEKNVFFIFKIMPTIRKGLKSLELENKKIDDKCSSLLEDWRKNLANDNPAKIDLMVESACYFPEEDSILEHFKNKNENIGTDETDEQLTLYLDGKVAKVGHLSFKAMKKIIQAWESADEVLVYDKACDKAGYDHTTSSSTLKHFFPDRPERGEIINPVVYRAICQLQKVLKNVFQKHGHLKECVIEVGRELAHSSKQRQETEKGQKTYKENKDKYVKEFKGLFNREPRGDELTKYRLWKEQTHRCLYSEEGIAGETFKRDIKGENLLQIDHIIPYSRCFDNTMNNKVLVYTKENLQKKNQTPYEYFGGASDSTRWQNFNTFINSLNLRQAKKNKLLITDFKEKEGEFRDRNLIDTQYIAKLATAYLKEFKNSKGETIPIICRKGGITADLRHRWGLNKDRSKGDKHHAMDAIVLAVSTNAQMQRITRLHQKLEDDSKYEEIRKSKIKEAKEKKEKMKEYREKELFREEYKQYFLEPWIGFRKDVLKALGGLFVSHRVSRKVTGPAHEKSIYAWDDNKAKIKTSLANISKDGWKDLLPTLPEDARNKVAKRLDEYNFELRDLERSGEDISEKLKDIFQKPIVYQNKHGQSEKISSFRVPRSDQKTGLHVHGATAEEKKKNLVANGSMLRIDVFKTEKGGFIASPLYVSDVVKKNLPLYIKDKKTEEWREMEKEEQESLTFCFSLQKNDLIEYVRKDKKDKKEYIYRGYYNGFDISPQSIAANAPDRRHFLRKEYKENEGTWEEVKLGGNENEK
ncbi:MAG: type II CRISPR RNA-guided endonuclease Cas9, partial [Gammaproteobacteria bacterium]|nr:type II CRISPR RNA-guided endonuclease Cas9 [Gammaproteobacteria bacterium]